VRVPVRIATTALPVLASILVGCGSSSPTAAPPSATASPVASPSPSAAAVPGLLLEVTTEGGFINPASRIGDVPSIVVDDDGRIYTPGAPGGDTQPLIPPVDVRDVGTVGATAIEVAIAAAGLDQEEAGGGGIAADTGTTVFTTVANGDTIVNRFVAGPGGPGRPGGGSDGSPVPGASSDPAAAAFALLDRLTDPTESWGATGATASPYHAAAYRVFVAPAAADTDLASAPPAWPLATPLASFGTPAAATLGVDGLRSGIVTGADATAVANLAHSLAAGATVESGGQTWTLWIRPLFPDELAS
jgi:hypothetical protein